ncbi:hypothetical protein DV495_002941 [Geotrichum candidum]|uniref:Similar to Saccharomyces cerevisiae YFR007W YFH7 Putative kinase with similarity to the phosphoribulokinase/uridine kinase/bacterial pantothenate kinase (PRK/URK/PANK) subfamily of P-loop kinases n=1 Tax=Geotrichum candidum TaxID=1173061 RepID=A0A0J9XB51_GEOCN|nr:hypothetical protein DV454_004302 [Geotrichum candidum]KAI9213373.1 hypothetical protein DS838_001712 [Geotrichum bryndzae]KAF5128797.1 hypothetical protein DV495_002941 [Geotrichum candidum]KAF7498135.1 hypothetical protein DV113_003848 [Geotrichum candidum]KAI8134387.1 hypothetical protein DUD61_001943 [Geotrichum candidum]
MSTAILDTFREFHVTHSDPTMEDTILHTLNTKKLSIMERKYHQCALRALAVLRKSRAERVVITIGGIPGSGKSTLSKRVSEILNDAYKTAHHQHHHHHHHHNFYSHKNHSASSIDSDDTLVENDVAFSAVVTMDGYHYTRAQLDQFPDPVEAHKRRGAPFTFDAEGVLSMAKTLHESTDSHIHNTLYFPSFDHEVKDPVENGLAVYPETKIVFLEGLYTLLSIAPWSQISELYSDDTWRIDLSLDYARTRLAARHLQAGLVDTLQAGLEKVDVNDGLNCKFIIDNSISNSGLTIESVNEKN